MCRPDIAPMTERVCELDEAYNLNLALHQMEHVDGIVSLVASRHEEGSDGARHS
jgi:hypothetical protein